MFVDDYPPLAPEELAACGQMLFGVGWRAETARRLGVTQIELGMVESGQAPAPAEWRPKLIALAQDLALKAMETASDLMWRGAKRASAEPSLTRPAQRLV